MKKAFKLSIILLLITAVSSCDDDSIFHAKVKTSNGITTVSDIRAGGLQRAFLIGISSVNHLVINDTIDSRDFQTMRDKMTNLSVLDLSNATIAAYNGSEGSGGSRVYHYAANQIPEFAFYNPFTSQGKKSLTTIIFPTSLKSIKNYAFNSTGLSGVLTIPSSVRDTIGKNAFSFCEGLTTVNLSAVSYIGESAFQACSNLTGTLVIPDSVFKVNPWAFAYCEKISAVSISKMVNSIGTATFLNCGGEFTVDAENTSYSSLDGVLFNADQSTIVRFPFNKSGSYTMPETVGDIAPYSFANCSALTEIDIPEGVFSIGANALFMQNQQHPLIYQKQNQHFRVSTKVVVHFMCPLAP